MFGASEMIAKMFHDAREALAPGFGYRTREASAKPWGEVPEQNRKLMIATVQWLVERGTISYGPTLRAEIDRMQPSASMEPWPKTPEEVAGGPEHDPYNPLGN